MDNDFNSVFEIRSGESDNILSEEYHYTRDPSFITNFLKTMLFISLLVSFVSIISDIMQMNLLNSYFYSRSQAEANDSRQQIIALISIGIFIITGISFLMWIYRANINCHSFTDQAMEFTSGWSVGWYFIPFANLYKPYKVMKEIWNISENPVEWKNKSGSGLLVSWWALWLLAGFLGQLSFRLSLNANTISSLKSVTVVSIISGIFDIPLDIVCIILISLVIAKQNRLVKKIT